MNFDFRLNTEKTDMIIQPPVDSSQAKKYIFRIGSSQDYIPIDWYKAYFHVTLDIKKATAGTSYGTTDTIALTSDSCSLINSFKFESDSRQIYYVNDINYATVTKNLMELSNEYINTANKRCFIYPDLVNTTDIAKYTINATTKAVEGDNDTYNAMFHKRMNLSRNTLDLIIPLNSMEFFQSMKDVLLPPTKIEITVDIETDNILLFKDAGIANGKITIKDIFLCYEKLSLNAANKLLYTKFLSSPQTIKFYRESINAQTSLKKREKNIILYETCNKPREIFIWFADTANRNSQNNDSFKIDTDDYKIINASVVINDNRHVPITPFNCVTKNIEAYNELLKYLTNKNRRESTFIDYELFKTKYMILYFDLKNNLTDTIRDAYSKIEFNYILNEDPGSEYTVYSLLLYEDQYKISLINGKSEIIK